MQKVLILFSYCLFVAVIVYYFQQAPDRKNPDSSFDVKNAYNNLNELSVKLGPRVIGTKQELMTIELLRSKLSKIKECIKVGSLEIYEQKDSGSYSFEVASKMRHIHYRNITNIIAYLRPKGAHYNDTFMINSHYDSGISTPGYYDDGVPTVVMLETLQTFCTFNKTLKHPVLFLFNSAEETGLQDQVNL